MKFSMENLSLSFSLSETRFEDRLLVEKNLRINLTDDDEHGEKFIQEKGWDRKAVVVSER